MLKILFFEENYQTKGWFTIFWVINEKIFFSYLKNKFLFFIFIYYLSKKIKIPIIVFSCLLGYLISVQFLGFSNMSGWRNEGMNRVIQNGMEKGQGGEVDSRVPIYIVAISVKGKKRLETIMLGGGGFFENTGVIIHCTRLSIPSHPIH